MPDAEGLGWDAASLRKPAAPGFRDLLAPVDAEDFLRGTYRQTPLHVPGAASKFAKVFSWEMLNDLLRMTTIWSDHNCELSKDGLNLRPELYCFEGPNRDNVKAWKPDFERVMALMRDGATMTLNFLERLTPELRAVSQSLAAVLGAPVNCSAFLSWDGTQGYPSHFDTTNVFALHIAGSKTWRLYERRLPRAAHTKGARYGDFPQEHHERVKGAVQQEMVMTPGDLLYIPHGHYHDALSGAECSLHLSFAVRHMVAQDFVDLLSRDLPKDPLFRDHLPAFDDPTSHSAVRGQIAQRLAQIVSDPQIGEDLRHYLRGRAYEMVADFQLPLREAPRRYRVRWMGRRLQRLGASWRLEGSGVALDLGATEGAVCAWVMDRDLFSEGELARAFGDLAPAQRTAATKRLEQAGLLQVI